MCAIVLNRLGAEDQEPQASVKIWCTTNSVNQLHAEADWVSIIWSGRGL